MAKQEYLNRDVSWIQFNNRVSDETKKDIPLSEKTMFHGIVFSNLNEFMQVRYPSSIELDAEKDVNLFVEAVTKHYQKMMNRFFKFNKTYDLVRRVKSLSKDNIKWAEKYFRDNIFPCLQPITVKRVQTIYLHSGMFIVVKMNTNDNDPIGYIEIPSNMDRFIQVPDKSYVVTIEDMISYFIEDLFRDRKIEDYCVISLHRSAEVYVQPNYYMDAYDLIKETLAEREKSWITYVEVQTDSKKMVKLIQHLLPLTENTVVFVSDIISLMDLKDFPNVFDKKDQFRKHTPIETFPNTSLFDYIKKKDRLAFHPYESYETSFVRFIQEASNDPKVISIKICLYRVSNNSKIIEALLKAADNGKIVTTLVELKARFDEHHNMDVANILRKGGVRIVYTKPDIKTHAKVCLVTRKEKKGIRIYSHVATGNYSESNSKLYSDYSYFTANQKVGADLTKFFNLLTSDQEPFKSKQIVYAPYNMRSTILENIEEQIKLAKNGKKGQILFKCNALTDDKIADKIVEASEAGVKVTLIIRSACILQPQKNIAIYSIVGRFLEHSRVYIFGSFNDCKLYIGSNDLMVRNLSRRNELMIMIEEADIKKRILKHMGMYLKDNVNRRKIQEKYQYKDLTPDKKGDRYDCQEAFIKEAKRISLD